MAFAALRCGLRLAALAGLVGEGRAQQHAGEEPHIVWRQFGADTGCGKFPVAGPLTAVLAENATSMSECQALCEQHRSELGCRSVLYAAQTSSCELLFEPVRYTHVSPGVECATVVGMDPVEVFVMLPLDTISDEGALKDHQALSDLLDKMQEAGVDGFMTDVWWGITEMQPREYNFSGYRELFDMARARGWKVQVVTSFHQCGGNVGDECNIPLPPFVREASGVWYTDADGNENHEYISLFADDVEIGGRTPIDMYRGFLDAFQQEFTDDLGTLITEVMVGMGPAGELRYPAYPLESWAFCGVGGFQAFDEHARAGLRAAATDAGHAAWGSPPSVNSTGGYNSYPADTEFFSETYKTDYGSFFLDWYSGALKMHGRRVLAQANAVFRGRVGITGKLAGIHWWYDTDSHPAEATAGYYNANGRNAYLEFASVFAAEGASMDFTCLEMRHLEQPRHCNSNPEGLVRQTIDAARTAGVPFSGENALARYDHAAHEQMLSYRRFMESFTFLRLDTMLTRPENLARFTAFVSHLHGVTTFARVMSASRQLAEATKDDPHAPILL